MNKFYFKPITQSDESQRIVNRSGSFLKTIKILFFSAAFLVTGFGNVWGQNANTYTFYTRTGGAAINPTYTAIVASNNDDLASSVQNIGFNFVYEGTTYTQFSANSNGLVRLGGTAVANSWSNDVAGAANQPKIMPLWDDLSTGSGNVRFGVSGSAPNRICVIDFRLFNGSSNGTFNLNFQVRLYETTNAIEFFYGTGTTTTSSSCGIGGTTATNYISVSTSGSTSSTSTANNTNTAWPGSGRLYVFSRPSIASVTASVAPTSVTGTTSICSGSSTTLTSNGGTVGTDAINVWSTASCLNQTYFNPWTTFQYHAGMQATTINSIGSGLINLTSTSGDPFIDMTGLGSFNPSTFRYINIRFRVTSVTQPGGIEIFWYNTAFPAASGSQFKNQTVSTTQNVWQTVSLDMSVTTAGSWTGSNITGWRFDWATASGVTMDIDFISLSDIPLIGTGTSITVSPTSTTTYFTQLAGASNRTTCASQAVTVGPQATPGTFQYANGSTQTICPGSTISCTNSTSPTNGGANTLSVVWYCGELLSGLPGSGTYGNWVRSTTAATGLLAATGTNATALTNYNPLTDFPGKTNFLIIRRAFTNVCGECAGPGSCLDQSFYLNVNTVSAAPAITGSYCPGATSVSGTGINGSTISVIRGGSSIGTATVSGGVWTATVSTLAAGNVLTATQTQSGLCVSAASASNTVLSPSTAPTINATICPGGTTVSGTGVNGSTISVIRSGSSIGTATVSGGVWTATVSTVNAGDVITATQTTSGACVSAASSSVTVRPIIN